MRPLAGAALGICAVLSACDRPAPAAAPGPKAAAAPANDVSTNDAAPTSHPNDVPYDLFRSATPDAWAGIRGSGGVVGATARLTPDRDAALVTWQDFGQIWCGTAIPEAQCKGGRFVLLIVRPEALPAAGRLGVQDTPIAFIVNGGPAFRHAAPNGGPDISVRGDVSLTPSRLYGFEILIDYGERKALRVQLQHCRTIEVRLLHRSFRFACDHLPDDI
jgi:hypothetical protein